MLFYLLLEFILNDVVIDFLSKTMIRNINQILARHESKFTMLQHFRGLPIALILIQSRISGPYLKLKLQVENQEQLNISKEQFTRNGMIFRRNWHQKLVWSMKNRVDDLTQSAGKYILY